MKLRRHRKRHRNKEEEEEHEENEHEGQDLESKRRCRWCHKSTRATISCCSSCQELLFEQPKKSMYRIWAYSIHKAKRVYSVGDTDSRFVQLTNFRLPQFLDNDVWLRHGYNEKEIYLTLLTHSPLHLWHKCMQECLTIANSAVKPSYASANAFIYGGKQIACDKLVKHLHSILNSGSNSRQRAAKSSSSKRVLLRLNDESHSPPLPIHVVPRSEYSSMVRACPTGASPSLEYDRLFAWKNIACVPMSYEPDTGYVLLTRVVRQDVYHRMYGKATCMTLQPVTVVVDGEPFSLMEESFYVCSNVVWRQNCARSEKTTGKNAVDNYCEQMDAMTAGINRVRKRRKKNEK